MAFYPLEKLHRLNDGYRKAFRVGEHSLLLLEIQGQRFLLDNRCPHAGHPLLESTIQDNIIRCPLHGIAFHLHTGKPTNAEILPAEKCLKFHKLIYQENTVGVDL